MKNLIKKATVFALVVILGNVLRGQSFEITCDNTQTCSGITVDVYDASSNLLIAGVAIPGGTSSTAGIIGSCQAGTPSYVVFNEGSCSINVNVNSTYNCGAGGTPPCNCTCITSGTSYQATLSTPGPPGSGCTQTLYIYIY